MSNTAGRPAQLKGATVLGARYLNDKPGPLDPQAIIEAEDITNTVFDLGMEWLITNMTFEETNTEHDALTMVIVVEEQMLSIAESMDEIDQSLPCTTDLLMIDRVTSKELQELLADPRWADHPCCIRLGWVADTSEVYAEGQFVHGAGVLVLDVFEAPDSET